MARYTPANFTANAQTGWRRSLTGWRPMHPAGPASACAHQRQISGFQPSNYILITRKRRLHAPFSAISDILHPATIGASSPVG